eukprot:UC4_evm2s139
MRTGGYRLSRPAAITGLTNNKVAAADMKQMPENFQKGTNALVRSWSGESRTSQRSPSPADRQGSVASDIVVETSLSQRYMSQNKENDDESVNNKNDDDGNLLFHISPGGAVESGSAFGVCAKSALSSFLSQFGLSDGNKGETNAVTTTKYTYLNFIPKNLFEQLQNFANVFFLFVATLNYFPQFGAFDKTLAFVPVAVVLSLIAVMDFYYDQRRRSQDHHVNYINNCLVWRESSGKYESIAWCKVRVGDFIKISKEELIPADCLIVKSVNQDWDGQAFMQTANLDGETNLKARRAIFPFRGQEEWESFDPVKEFRGPGNEINAEGPNEEIYSMNGNVKYTFKNRPSEETAISSENMLLRGCKLKTADEVIAVAIHVGEFSKERTNAKSSRHKQSKLERDLNKNIIYCFGIMIVLCFITGILAGNFVYEVDHDSGKVEFVVGDHDAMGKTPEEEGFFRGFGAMIIYQVMIPISLYFSIQLVKVLQLPLINSDPALHKHHVVTWKDGDNLKSIASEQIEAVTVEEIIEANGLPMDQKEAEQKMSTGRRLIIPNNGKPFNCRTHNIHEDLGMVEFVFSDKTGTLTQNEMIFERCVIGSKSYMEERRDSLTNTLDFVHPDLDLLKALGDRFDPKNKECVFMLLLAACNNILPLQNENGSVKYEAESPDELALVAAARSHGFFLKDREGGLGEGSNIVIELKTGQKKFKLLKILPFDNVRKAMSVVIEVEGECWVLTKGADSSVLPNCLESKDKSAITEAIIGYSKLGLRTLAMGFKLMTAADYSSWERRYDQVQQGAAANKEELLLELHMELERKLTIVGATGVEDKLQDQVPETIRDLRSAGIDICVLTGDKQDTALEIAKNCNLVTESDNISDFTLNGKDALDTKVLMKSKWKEFQERFLKNNKEKPSVGMLIDGATIAYALNGDDDARDSFLNLCISMRVLVCCRVTPKQKSEMIRQFKLQYKKVHDRNIMALAIGDGANDVPMILEADVGVGIYGKEGMQAVMSSDYSMGEFQFLKTLLLVHGHWSYDRIARMILYFLFKNVSYVFLFFFFMPFCGWSGSYSIDQGYLWTYNLFWTAITPIAWAVFDQDVSRETLLLNPILFQQGQKDKLHKGQFWYVILEALYVGVICFFIPYGAFVTGGNSRYMNGTSVSEMSGDDLLVFGTVQQVALILAVTFKIIVEQRYHTQQILW